MERGQSPSKRLKFDKNALQRLKQHSQIVADTGKFSQIEAFHPTDSTTNPTLILQAVESPEFQPLLTGSIDSCLTNFSDYIGGRPTKSKKKLVLNQPFNFDALDEETQECLVELICDRLAIGFGVQILKIITGLVSTQVSAGLSYDTVATVERAERIIRLYEKLGVKRDRVLIKIAATWQGIKAAQALNKKKIRCNMTLIFNFHQAVACAQAGVYLISPFVGRILDWHKKQFPQKDFTQSDPGVKSVTDIYNYFKKHDHKTIIMGASFRNVQQVVDLAGCDKLTVSPNLLQQLAGNMYLGIEKRLCIENAKKMEIAAIKVTEKVFRWEMNEDAMAVQKLAEGIRNFNKDLQKLKLIIIGKLRLR